MRYISVWNTSRNIDLGRKVRVATSFMERAQGLLATPSLGVGEGMYLAPCKSIHTLFMRYPIDVLFLDDKGTVLSGKTLKPWRMSAWVWKCAGVLELSEGSLARTGTQAGDRIEMKDVN